MAERKLLSFIPHLVKNAQSPSLKPSDIKKKNEHFVLFSILLLLLDANVFLRATSTWGLWARFILRHEAPTWNCGFCLFAPWPHLVPSLFPIHCAEDSGPFINLKLLLDAYIFKSVIFITLSTLRMSALHKGSAPFLLVEFSWGKRVRNLHFSQVESS